MNNNSMLDWRNRDRYVQVVLEQFRYHARHYGLHLTAPMLVNEAQIARMLDQHSHEFALQLSTLAIKGETSQETKGVEHSYSFDVFENWTDHLKYQIKKRRLLKWMPAWIVNKLVVRYRKEVKTRHETVAIAVTRVCPHATFKWDGHERRHINFLFPSKDLE